MPAVQECPGCGRRLELGASLPAAHVQCPGCRLTFPVEEALVPMPPETPAKDAPGDVNPAVGPTQQLSLDEPAAGPVVRQPLPRQPAPMKAVLVNEDLVLPSAVADSAGAWPGPRRDCEPHRAGLLFFLSGFGVIAAIVPGCFILGLPVSAITWVLARRDIDMMLQGEMDPSGLAVNQAARRNALFGTVFGCLWLTASLLFFAFCLP